MRAHLKKALAFILMLTTVCSVFVGCVDLNNGNSFIDPDTDAATDIATQLGVSEAVIGLTVVALGTSLPELVTSAVAARKGNSDIALGNVVGSCIFNVLFILGTTALVQPLNVARGSLVDQLVLLGVCAYLFFTAYTGRKLKRWEGISYLGIYGVYLAYLLIFTI